jgi:hypothetical protein
MRGAALQAVGALAPVVVAAGLPLCFKRGHYRCGRWCRTSTALATDSVWYIASLFPCTLDPYKALTLEASGYG